MKIEPPPPYSRYRQYSPAFQKLLQVHRLRQRDFTLGSTVEDPIMVSSGDDNSDSDGEGITPISSDKVDALVAWSAAMKCKYVGTHYHLVV